ncbi:T9SS type A sorting domain-containing protein [bacterium]|nr:MAG: T9SS type A sorting domain-containing protein [bacterium]
MKIFLSLLIINSFLISQENTSILTINIDAQNEVIVSVDSQIHIDYGLSYPITYEFDIPQGLENLNAYRKYRSAQDWNLIDEKTDDDFFNGIEAVRFDYNENIAYISVGFSIISDSIFIRIVNSTNENINASYMRMSEYYDNREAVVTVTADDWADYSNAKFIQACQNFRSYNLWYSVAIITGWISNQNTWDDIQAQLDDGLIEVVAHSRTHPYAPYNDLEGEVAGSKQDIINNLNLLNHNRSGINEYVYAWVAPFGDYDAAIDSATSNAKYLVSRLFYYNENYFSNWNNDLYKFDPVGATIEVGSSDYWGSTNINELNTAFDNVVDSNGVYHLVTHPNILEWDEDFTWVHLEHISNRKDIWYVGFGHLYLYRFVQSAFHENILASYNDTESLLKTFMLYPNYPNPFNPTTTIRYNLLQSSLVNITIYDMMGRKIKTLINQSQDVGQRSIVWKATNDFGHPVSTGIYLYQIHAGDNIQTKKMIFLK